MRRAVAVGVLIVFVTAALVSGAAAAAPRALTRVGEVPPRPAGMRVVGSLAATTRISVTITLQPPDPAALQRYANAVSTPGSGDFRHYLSVAGFRARFGPSDNQIAAVRTALLSAGLTPRPVSRNGLTITVSGTASQLSSAFATSFDRVKLAGGRTAYLNTRAPALPSPIASTVQSVTGLNSLAVAHPLGLHRRRPARGDHPDAARTNVNTGGPEPCDAGRSPPYGHTADELASSYGFSGLYGQQDLGAGKTIGLLELEPYETSDISKYESCYGISPSVTDISVDGFDATGLGQGEANGDIEDVVGLAPSASVLVYQAPNSYAGILDDLTQMVSDDAANVMSTSWGICETATPPDFVAAENLELEEAAVQGQSFFTASGDAGSSYCGSGQLSVADPGGQPFSTAVGGTQLSALGPPPTETTWNDFGYASTGGISRRAAMPAYQLDAAPSVGVIGVDSSGTPCGAPAGGYCREVPDVSASSSDIGGYDFYWDGYWGDWYGTSFAAPLWAALTALANASPACTGGDVGFINPLLYQLAGSDYGQYFNDITTGNNDVGDHNGSLYPASAGYDMATGLGSPIGAALAQGLCDGKRAGVTLASPGQQTGTVGTPVNVSLHATDSNSADITYAEQGLPAGLTVDPATGAISGIPTSAGVSTVTVVASDTYGATAAVVFGWNVASRTPAVTTTVDNALTDQPWSGNETAGAAAYASASVTGGGPAPTGTLTYDFYANAACADPVGSSQTVSLTAGGAAPDSAATAALSAGSYSYRAVYSGDPDYDAVVGPCQAFVVLASPSGIDSVPTSTTSTPAPANGTAPPASTASPPAVSVAPHASRPRATIVKLKITQHRNATITFGSTGATTRTYQCALAKRRKPTQQHRAPSPNPAYRGCRSPATYRHLTAGRYALLVRVRIASGGYSSPAAVTFTIS